MSDTAAKPEYCSACGRPLPSHRILLRSPLSGTYQPVHNSRACVDLFNARNTPDPLAVNDTSNQSWPPS